jgi:hypothetical protein
MSYKWYGITIGEGVRDGPAVVPCREALLCSRLDVFA